MESMNVLKVQGKFFKDVAFTPHPALAQKSFDSDRRPINVGRFSATGFHANTSSSPPIATIRLHMAAMHIVDNVAPKPG